MEELEIAPSAAMEELEQQWRAEAEAKRPEFEADVRTQIGNNADHVDIENIVSGDVENYIVNKRILFQQTASRLEELQKVRNKVVAAKAQRRFNLRKRILEEDLPHLSREDTNASHAIKAAKAAKLTSDAMCTVVLSRFQSLTDDLKLLGEAPDAIPSARIAIPNVFAEATDAPFHTIPNPNPPDPTAFVPSIDFDVLKEELDAAKKKIKELEAPPPYHGHT
ncbi:MAG: hypothetical protein GY883_18350 [Shimia sp.]|nr:hypothetical protein [Shimia sp.]